MQIYGNEPKHSVLIEEFGRPRSEASIERAQTKIAILSGDQLPLESKQIEALASLGDDKDLTVSQNSSTDQECENQPQVKQTLHKSLYPDLDSHSTLPTLDSRTPIIKQNQI